MDAWKGNGRFRLTAEVARVVSALGAAIVGASLAVERRDELLGRAWALQGELRAAGARVPSLSFAFSPEAVGAGRKLRRLIDDEMALNPLSGATRDFPQVFK